MPETLAVTLGLELYGLKRVALITDGRFSGASSGPCIGHVSPEAAAGGPIAALRDGDVISIDIPGRRLEVGLSQDEIASRLRERKPIAREVPPGYMRRYVRMVSSAAKGAVLE
jgi:dihydroxy-acid dehydratase